MEIEREDFKRLWSIWDDAAYVHTSVRGFLKNAVPPWGTVLLGAPCRAAARNMKDTLYIEESSDAALARVLNTPWSTHECEQVVGNFWCE